MRCYQHPEAEAVAICTACARGLCRECHVDMTRGSACRGRCEHEVRRLLDLRDFSFAQPAIQAAALKRADRTYSRNGLFLLAMGVLFIGVGLYFGRRSLPAAGLGLVFVAFGVSHILMARAKMRTDQFRLCPGCGYNTTGNTTGRCPECGYHV